MEVAGTIGARQKAGRAAEQPGEDRGSGGEKAGLQPRAADEAPNEEPDERPNAGAPRPVGAAPGRVGVRKKGMIAGQRRPGLQTCCFPECIAPVTSPKKCNRPAGARADR